MKVALRLGLYAAGLVVVFVASATIADALVPEQTVRSWTSQVDEVDEVDEVGHDDTDR